MENDVREPDPAESAEVPEPIVLRGVEGQGGVFFVDPPVEVMFKSGTGMMPGLVTGIHNVDVCIIEVDKKIFFRSLKKLEADNGCQIIVEVQRAPKQEKRRTLPGCSTIGALMLAATGAILAAQGCGPRSEEEHRPGQRVMERHGILLSKHGVSMDAHGRQIRIQDRRTMHATFIEGPGSASIEFRESGPPGKETLYISFETPNGRRTITVSPAREVMVETEKPELAKTGSQGVKP